jgi:hypothetical protein
MKASTQAIVNLLQNRPDGLTTLDLAEQAELTYSAVYSVTKRHKLIFIDRWQPSRDGKSWVPVWCLAQIHDDAPIPTMKASEYLRTQERRAA